MSGVVVLVQCEGVAHLLLPNGNPVELDVCDSPRQLYLSLRQGNGLPAWRGTFGGDFSTLPNNPIMCLAPPLHIILHHPNSPPPDLYVDGILLESPCTFVLYSHLT